MKKLLFLTYNGDAILNCILCVAESMNCLCDILVIQKEQQRGFKNGSINTVYIQGEYNLKKESFEDESITRISKEIERLDSINSYNAIISCSGLFDVHRIVLGIEKTHSKWFLYMVDPYTYNHSAIIRDINIRREKELEVISKCSGVFCTPMMYKEYLQDTFLNVYRSKFVSVELPLIKPTKHHFFPASKDSAQIEMVFAGRLYPSIRKPDYLLSMMKRLPSSFHLLMIGYIPNRYRIMIKLNPILKKKVSVVDRVNQNELQKILLLSDVLVNIGNNVNNQLPSKLIEYFNYAKPVLNIYCRPDCCTLSYTTRYPLSINVFTGNEIHISVQHFVREFEHCRNKTISTEQILKCFKQNTPEFVARQFIYTIEVAHGTIE